MFIVSRPKAFPNQIALTVVDRGSIAWGTDSQSTPTVTGWSSEIRESHSRRGNRVRESSSVLPKVSMARMAGIRMGGIARESEVEGIISANVRKIQTEKETISSLPRHQGPR